MELEARPGTGGEAGVRDGVGVEAAKCARGGRLSAYVEGGPGAVAVHVPMGGVLAGVGVGRALARSAGGPCRRGGPWYGLGRAAGGRRRRTLAVVVVRARAPHAIELVRRLRAAASLESDALLVGPLPFAHEGQWSG
jgi:hypothetical protein